MHILLDFFHILLLILCFLFMLLDLLVLAFYLCSYFSTYYVCYAPQHTFLVCEDRSRESRLNFTVWSTVAKDGADLRSALLKSSGFQVCRGQFRMPLSTEVKSWHRITLWEETNPAWTWFWSAKFTSLFPCFFFFYPFFL